MSTHKQIYGILISLCLLCSLLTSCQAGGLLGPTLTPSPLPTLTPSLTTTITSTPEPQVMTAEDLLKDCANLAELHRQVILQGRLFIPEESISGYTFTGETWLGMKLISSLQTIVLIRQGKGINEMDALPTLFTYKDLIVRAEDGRIIRNGHLVSVTGRPRYTDKDGVQKCEVFADKMDSLMDPAVLVPVGRTVKEMTNGDVTDECWRSMQDNPDVNFVQQFIRLAGSLKVDKDTTSCTVKSCTLCFEDNTGTMMVTIPIGEGPNTMRGLPPKPTQKDLVLQNQQGQLIDPSAVVLIGLVAGEPGYCTMTVFEIE